MIDLEVTLLYRTFWITRPILKTLALSYKRYLKIVQILKLLYLIVII